MMESEKDYSRDYLTFTAIESGTFSFTEHGSGDSLQYSLDDGTTWTTLASDVASPTVSAGDKIIWKGTRTPGDESGNYGIGKFSATGKFNASGNIMSLLYGDNFSGQVDLTGKRSAFRLMFNNNNKLINAENLILPATTLSDYCYMAMFYYCTSLISTPTLPAVTLKIGCYFRMFESCRLLTSAPTLPATTLGGGCYRAMFRGCTALVTSPKLSVAILLQGCYREMFENCTSLANIECLATDISATDCTTNWLGSVSATGTFVKADGVEWPSGVDGIPNGWTVEVAVPDV